MPMALSELLNPAPTSKVASLGSEDEAPNDPQPTSDTHEFFAPELFQTPDGTSTNSKYQEESARTASAARKFSNETREISEDAQEDGSGVHGDQSTYIKSEMVGQAIDENSGFDGTARSPSTQDVQARQLKRNNTTGSTGGKTDQGSERNSMGEQNEGSVDGPQSGRKSKSSSSPPKPRPQKSSTKNEGQHTDKRYLCYMCNKLFTRRRSVRDHLSKIHNTKTWEPSRSLEIIVDPSTGEPVEPLEAQLYKTAAKPPPISENGQDEEGDEVEEAEVDPPDQSSPPPPSTIANLKTEASVAGSRASSVDNFTTPAPIIGKKRPAPLSASTKKGMARTKNANTPNKKPKLATSENISDSPMFRSPSATPASGQHRAPLSKLKRQSSTNFAESPTPPASSRAPSPDPHDSSEDEDGEPENDVPYSAADTPNTNSDGEVFCICRRGDNHTWMIACDGGCEEWYHGKCVDIRERDGDLIDKYICPSCNLRGVGQTTWKRMCRRKGCRKPARVLHDPPSKYCSADCGRRFFVELVVKGDEGCGVSKNGQFILETEKAKKYRKRQKNGEERYARQLNGNAVNGTSNRPHTPASEDNERSEYETDSSADDDMLPNRGGPLRAGEVRAIVDRCKTIDAWAVLGKKPTEPPAVHGLDGTADDNVANGMQVDLEVQLDDFEKAQLAKLTSELESCQQRIESLVAKEKLLDMIKERSGKITDEVKKSNQKMKDLCGFDPRLSWTEDEFLTWRATEDGATALESGKLGPPESISRKGDRDTAMQNGINCLHDDDEEGEDNMPTKGGVCIKNRCARHGKWGKMQLAEVRFEQDIVNKRKERLKREEESLRSRAVVRMWEEQR